MRKFLLLILLTGLSYMTYAQVTLNVMSGYQFFGRAKTYEGELRVKENFNIVGQLDFGSSDAYFKLMYVYQPSAFSFQRYGSYNIDELSDLNIHYILAGGDATLNPEAEVMLYGGLMAGIGIYSPTENQYSSITRMTFGLNAGLKMELTDAVGIKLQSTLFLPVQYTGGGLLVSTNGVAYGSSSGTLFTQLGVNLGVTYTFGNSGNDDEIEFH